MQVKVLVFPVEVRNPQKNKSCQQEFCVVGRSKYHGTTTSGCVRNQYLQIMKTLPPRGMNPHISRLSRQVEHKMSGHECRHDDIGKSTVSNKHLTN